MARALVTSGAERGQSMFALSVSVSTVHGLLTSKVSYTSRFTGLITMVGEDTVRSLPSCAQ